MAAKDGELDAFGGISNRLQPRIFEDLRGWIDALRSEDELQEINVEVDWDCELGTVARKSGLPAKTIRYYEEIGLIPPPPRTEGGYRDYSEDDLQVLRFVQRSRGLGFSVKDVGSLLALWRDRERE